MSITLSADNKCPCAPINLPSYSSKFSFSLCLKKTDFVHGPHIMVSHASLDLQLTDTFDILVDSWNNPGLVPSRYTMHTGLCNRYLFFLLRLLWYFWGPYHIGSCQFFLSLIWFIKEYFVHFNLQIWVAWILQTLLPHWFPLFLSPFPFCYLFLSFNFCILF